jgi:glycosyltransferase involved in cell wall biosynthesis
MRVLQLIETGGPGGAETVFANLATALRDRGHHVHCMVGDGSWLPAEVRGRGLNTELLVPGTSLDLGLLRAIRTAIRREQIDVVHAHLFDAAVYAAVASSLEGCRCVVTLHGQVDVRRSGLRTWIKRQLMRANADVVVVVSEALRRDIASVLHLPSDKLRVVPNGVQQAPSSSTTEPMLQSQPDDAPKRVVAVGNIRRPKNYPLLLEAFSLVRRELPHTLLQIVGEADRDGLHESLCVRAAEPDLAGAVEFHGFVRNPQSVLRGADAFVLASLQEGFSLATIEAMLAGVPVVATRSGGPEEIVKDGTTGLLVPVNDAVALASSLVRVLNDRAFAHTLAVAADADARSRFSMDAMVDQYLRIYEGRREGAPRSSRDPAA